MSISNQHLGDRELDQNNSLWQSVFDLAPYSIVLLKIIADDGGVPQDFKIIMLNAITLKSSNLTVGDVIGKSYSEVFPGSRSAGIIEKLFLVARSGHPQHFDKAHQVKDEVYWFHHSINRVNDLLVIITDDISNRKRAESLIQKHSSVIQLTEELAKTGSWEYDVQSGTLNWSEGMYRLLGIPPGTTVKPSFYLDYALEEDKPTALRLVTAIQEALESREETFRIQTTDGIKTITSKLIPLKNKVGKVEKVWGIDIDITEARQTEEKISGFNKALLAKNRELASLNSELKTFNSIAANDYNETLRQLYLSLEFIASNEGHNLSNSGRANVRRAQSVVQRMKLLTDDLVSYSRLQEVGIWEPRVDLNAILQEVLNDFDKRSFLVDANVDCKPLPQISGYPFLISLVFHHLIENAIRFKKEAHPPAVGVHCQESVIGSTLQHESARPDTIYHVITVVDEGIGFEKIELEKIFGIFYRINDSRNRHKGSGIGLAICKKIMDMHDGFIIAESEPGEGSSFHCFFPYEARQSPPL